MKSTFSRILLVTRLLAAGCALCPATGCRRPERLETALPRSDGPAAREGRVRDSALPLNPVYSRDIAPLLDRYCLGCHAGPAPEAGIVLDQFRDSAVAESQRPLLEKIAVNLRSRRMPPEGEKCPDERELSTLLEWIDGTLERGEVSPRPVAIGRLNRFEYNNTIRDLIGLDLRPADAFPADDIGYGFDNIAAVLGMPTILLERHLAAADSTISAAWTNPALKRHLLNPPADPFPLAFRRYTPPVRAPRVDKALRLAKPVVDPELIKAQHVYDVLRAFADRAWRRPATHDELTRLVQIAVSAEKDGEDLESAIRLALQAVLASPRFVFRLEHEPAAQGSATATPADDFGLASRLSYFLWSSMPDDRLLRLAGAGELRRGGILKSEAHAHAQRPTIRGAHEEFRHAVAPDARARGVQARPVLFQTSTNCSGRR